MDRLITDIEDATQSLPGLFGPDAVLETVEGWDSLGMALFIGIVAERTGVELAIEDLQECTTVRDLQAMLERKGDVA